MSDHHAYLENLARQDLGPDASQYDYDYHVAYLNGLDPQAFEDYLERLSTP